MKSGLDSTCLTEAPEREALGNTVRSLKDLFNWSLATGHSV